MHALRRARARSLTAVLACGWLAAAPALAAPTETTTYSIVGAWFDADAVYVKYRASYVRKAGFAFAIRGKVLESRTSHFIVSAARRQLAPGETPLHLGGGEPADDVVYRDRDLVVRREGDVLSVAGRDARAVLEDCVPSDWLDEGIARTADGLLVCGTFVAPSGRVEWRIPAATIHALQSRLGAANLHGPGAVGVSVPMLAPTFVGRDLVVTVDWAAPRPAEVLFARLDPAHPEAPSFATSPMGAASGVFGLRSARPSYAPSGGFVVGAGWHEAPRYEFCETSGCAPMPVGGACDLLVDAARRTAYCVQIGNASLPDARITRIDW